MGYFTVLLGLALSGVLVSAGVQEDMQQCIAPMANIEVMKIRRQGPDGVVRTNEMSSLEEACPKFQALIQCADDVSVRYTGSRIGDLALLTNDIRMTRSATLFANLKKVVGDLCTSGKDLHEAYKRNEECFRTEVFDATVCARSALTAYFTYREYEENRVDGNQGNIGIQCMIASYMHACFAAQIHDKCGQDAFEFYQTFYKRLGIHRLSICSGEDLAKVKTDFLDSLQLEQNRRIVYSQAFDLRKKRK